MLHPETKHGAMGRGRSKKDRVAKNATRSERFTATTAKATGKAERTIRLAVARRKEIYEALHPETKATYAGGSFKGNQHKEVAAKNAATSFTATTAKATGKAERDLGVNRDARFFQSALTSAPLMSP